MRAAWLTLLVFLGLGLGGTTALAADENTADQGPPPGGAAPCAGQVVDPRMVPLKPSQRAVSAYSTTMLSATIRMFHSGYACG